MRWKSQAAARLTCVLVLGMAVPERRLARAEEPPTPLPPGEALIRALLDEDVRRIESGVRI